MDQGLPVTYQLVEWSYELVHCLVRQHDRSLWNVDASTGAHAEEGYVHTASIVDKLNYFVQQNGQRGNAHAVLCQSSIIKELLFYSH